MANMSYCEMENTSKDLAQCLETLENYSNVRDWIIDADPSVYEQNGLMDLLETCKEIAEWNEQRLQGDKDE